MLKSLHRETMRLHRLHSLMPQAYPTTETNPVSTQRKADCRSQHRWLCAKWFLDIQPVGGVPGQNPLLGGLSVPNTSLPCLSNSPLLSIYRPTHILLATSFLMLSLVPRTASSKLVLISRHFSSISFFS